MKIDPQTRKSIIKNALLSVFIYLLPILLMFGSYYITGQKPWKNKVATSEKINKTNHQLNKKP